MKSKSSSSSPANIIKRFIKYQKCLPLFSWSIDKRWEAMGITTYVKMGKYTYFPIDFPMI